MLTQIFRMIFYQQEAVRYLSLLSARSRIRSRLLRISPLMEVLRTPAELELVLSDANKFKKENMSCQHRYDNGETALKKHGGKVVTAHCQLPGCSYRMRKCPDGGWVEWPREAPRSRAAPSGSSQQSQPFTWPEPWSATVRSATRPARVPPWNQTTRVKEEDEHPLDDGEPWGVMELDQDSGASSDL